MKTIGVFEGKTRFSALIADSLNGETTIITKNGHPVAEIGPVKSTSVERGKRAAARLEALRSRLAAEGKLEDLDIRSLIDEGRS
ncbi:MAG TPA: type II toxin-antitoxin system Phd/YefM family antitoxin [Candidatus Baltobacteraceae bacterium]|uniref:Prevent-host-death family protein n=1 Tax=mine drainage metagenome TaxID=410659 RepID=E6PGB1_9ZZZZ|nr:type II toxin-antitoxin system Phd/YefM family antitoxin [Candidatus Baltobacteraceae bacterium]